MIVSMTFVVTVLLTLYVIWEFSLFNLGYSSVLLIFTYVFITLILKVNPWNVNVVSQLYCYDKHATSQNA